VLVVDDVVTNLDVAKGMMKPYGMQIDCAISGQEAVDAIREEKVRYNAVFMDHMMPGMDGLEAVRIIREEIGTEYAKTVPIIALTANAIVGNETMFLNKGFQAFISKPIEISRLDSVIRQWVRDKKLEEKLGTINVNGILKLDSRSGQDRRVLDKIINGLDIGGGIDLFGGDEEAYLQILHSYAVNTVPLLDKIKNVGKDNLADYCIAVHGIKGSSRNIGAAAIGIQAEALEKAAHEGNLEYILDKNAAFIEVVEKLITELNEILKTTKEVTDKPKKDKLDSALCGSLITACIGGDIDTVDAIIKELDDFNYESDEGLMTWLRKNAEQMNYPEMAEKLRNR
jgi:CheY-like chemotaxis protein